MYMHEWRTDDANYGHYRRYAPDQLKRLLEKSALQVLEMWDYSFPFFWLMRRLYTPFLRKTGGAKEALTRVSHQNPLFDLSNRLLGRPWLWRPLHAVQDRFRHRYWGCHLLAVAKKP